MLQPSPWLTTLVLAALAAPALPAQDLTDVCRAANEAKLGQWASYELSGGRADGTTLRLAIVGSERRGDSTFYWFELATTSPKDPGRSMVMQLLVPGPGAKATSIRGMVMKAGAQPAMKLPEEMVGMMSQRIAEHNPALEAARRCQGGTVVGWETVTVPAGPVRALHIKSDDGGEGWVARDVPFAIVKVITKDGDTMALSGRGADAKSSITEQPQEMSLPGMMIKP